MKVKIVLLLIVILIAYITRAQTSPAPQNLPYSLNFGTSSFSTLPQGLAVWNGINGTTINTQILAEQSAPSGNASIAARTSPTNIGGAYGLATQSNARLYIQSSSNATEGLNQPIIAFYTGLANGVSISFDIEVIEAGSGRTLGMVGQYRAGNSGPWITIANSSKVYNNASHNADDVDLNGDVDSYTWNLNGLTANTNYQLRIAHWRGGSAGSSVGIAYDNIHLSPLPDFFNILGGGAYCAGGDGLSVRLFSSQSGVLYQLFHNDIAIGPAVEGTGTELDFGLQTQEGSYTVKAYFLDGELHIMPGEVYIDVQQPPSAAFAGEDLIICNQTTATLHADFPSLGIGTWTQLMGPPVDFSDLLSTDPIISNLTPGEYYFRWSVEYGVCPSSINDVMVLVLAPPSLANAGADIEVCNSYVQLNAQPPSSGQGSWEKLDGPGEVTFENENIHNSIVNLSIPGRYQFKWTVANGNCVSTTDEVEIIYNEAPAIIIGESPQQSKYYGENINPVLIIATDQDDEASQLELSISYSLNNGSLVDGLPGNLILELIPSGITEKEWRLFSGSGQNYPGVGLYEIFVKISDGCQAFVVQNIRIEILPGNVVPVADAFYTGSCFFWSNPNNKIASLTLAATIKNAPGTMGDIRTAKVSFYAREGNTLIPINGAQELPVGLINPNDTGLGSASTSIQYNLGVLNVSVLNIAVLISGNYAANDPAADKTITVAVPVPGGQICGGLNLLNIQSGGIISGATGWETNAGFSVQYNNGLKNPQGKFQIKFMSYNDRYGVAGTVIRTYVIRSNSITSFSINNHLAHFSGKASLSEIIDGVEQAIEGNCILQLQLADGSLLQPIRQDQMAITLFRNKGGIWFSGNWNGNSSQLQNILNGNLSVANSANSQKFIQSVQAFKSNREKSILVFPNPFTSEFILKIPGDFDEGPVCITIRDLSGRIIQRIKTNTNDKTIKTGGELITGVYIVQVSQGLEIHRVVLVKQ